ncbi:MAG: FAD-dependent oxidoreductase [Gammaproteobacteria bacterium]|nr:FAD-dependent oxidoreductase [Gammaproteobacteria bacterium]
MTESDIQPGSTPRRIAIVGAGISGLATAWGLSQHSDRFDFRIYEAQARIGGNAVTADMPQDDGSSIPFDISVTACIPSVYHHVLLLLEKYGIELVRTRFNYSVRYRDRIYAHDFDSELRAQLQSEITKFQRILKRVQKFGWLTRANSKILNALNPFNYMSMRDVLNRNGLSGEFRNQVLKPMFVNFLMATNVFDMPAALFARYLEFFDIESATPMQTWDQGTRRIYESMSSDFRDKIYLNRPVRKVYRRPSHVVIEDENGSTETFDDVVFACNANQTMMILDQPTRLENYILSSIRYESELHNHAIVHSDASVLPEDDVEVLSTRSNHIAQYGMRPDNYEITYIMHNQQPWVGKSDKPCLVTYNPNSEIDPERIVGRWWFQHVVHDVRHVATTVPLFRLIQGKRRTFHCGAHVLINSQETCFVSGLAVARQLGADYPFNNEDARKVFNHYGSIMHGWRFKKVKSTTSD